MSYELCGILFLLAIPLVPLAVWQVWHRVSLWEQKDREPLEILSSISGALAILVCLGLGIHCMSQESWSLPLSERKGKNKRDILEEEQKLLKAEYEREFIEKVVPFRGRVIIKNPHYVPPPGPQDVSFDRKESNLAGKIRALEIGMHNLHQRICEMGDK